MKPRPSMTKRQREQAKREKKALKAERRAIRKSERQTGEEAEKLPDAPEA